MSNIDQERAAAQAEADAANAKLRRIDRAAAFTKMAALILAEPPNHVQLQPLGDAQKLSGHLALHETLTADERAAIASVLDGVAARVLAEE